MQKSVFHRIFKSWIFISLICTLKKTHAKDVLDDNRDKDREINHKIKLNPAGIRDDDYNWEIKESRGR